MGLQSCAVMGFYGNWLVKLGMENLPRCTYSFYLFFYQIDPSFMLFFFSFFVLLLWTHRVYIPILCHS